ncbi:hypothetical protein LZ30DRAFT_116483 [Colletotrichum cereale]|nr:hypothetical protein LZ30DRAFT_116483 [Colletotrichum cereale]
MEHYLMFVILLMQDAPQRSLAASLGARVQSKWRILETSHVLFLANHVLSAGHRPDHRARESVALPSPHAHARMAFRHSLVHPNNGDRHPCYPNSSESPGERWALPHGSPHCGSRNDRHQPVNQQRWGGRGCRLKAAVPCLYGVGGR